MKVRQVLLSVIKNQQWTSLRVADYLPKEEPVKLDRPLTDEEYVERGGNSCPYCRRGDVAGSSFEFEGGSLYQEVSCNFCHKDWVDAYKLTGYIE